MCQKKKKLVEELLKHHIRVRLLLLQIRLIFYGFLNMISNFSSRHFAWIILVPLLDTFYERACP